MNPTFSYLPPNRPFPAIFTFHPSHILVPQVFQILFQHLGSHTNKPLGQFSHLWLPWRAIPLDSLIPPFLINIPLFHHSPQPEPLSSMPILRNTSRQETTLRTTNPPNLVVVAPPLSSKPLTTYFIISFSPIILSFLQYLPKTTKYPPSNSNKSGPQFLSFRPYVANLPYICDNLQYLWLPCGRPWQLDIFYLFSLTYAIFFSTLLTPLNLGSYIPDLLTVLYFLNQTQIPLRSGTMVGVFWGLFRDFEHRKRHMASADDPP